MVSWWRGVARRLRRTVGDVRIWQSPSSHQRGGQCLGLPAGVTANNGSPESGAALQELEEDIGCEGDLAE